MKNGRRSAFPHFHNWGKPAGAHMSLESLDSGALYLPQNLAAIQVHICKHQIYSTLKSQTSYPPLLVCTLINTVKIAQDKQLAILDNNNCQETKSFLFKREVQF